MWNAIKNVAKAAGSIAAIVSNETQYQFSKAADVSNSATTTLASKAAALRAKYEADLVDRKAGIIKPVVVTEVETPKDVVAVN